MFRDLFSRNNPSDKIMTGPLPDNGVPGAILTGDKILEEYNAGRIKISDFDSSKLNPNSYNISTGSTVSMYQNLTYIDLHNKKSFSEISEMEIPESGLMLRPGNLYLIPTAEKIETDYYIPLITGRSSIGRLGITVHQEAGFGDIGYSGRWTMQVRVTYPTKIYANIAMAQVYFLTPHGDITTKYNGRYQHSDGATPSRWEQD